MSARVRIDRQSPDVYSAMNRVVKVVREQATAAGLDRALIELVNMRASQINGCENCLDAHWRAGTAAGLTPQKLALLPAWRDSQLYDDRERAALAIAEAVTSPAAGPHLDDEQYAAVREDLTDDETSMLIWAAITINSYNRISILSRHPVPVRDAEGRAVAGGRT